MTPCPVFAKQLVQPAWPLSLMTTDATLPGHPPDTPDPPESAPFVTDDWVTTVLVSHDGAAWLPRTLAALAAQSHPTDTVVAVDTGSTDDSRALITEALGPSCLVEAGSGTGFGAAVLLGVAHAAAQRSPVPGEREWIWLLHDDAEPDPRALEHLLAEVTRDPSIGIAGPKVRGWYDRRLLLEVGVTIARSGRRETLLERREQDQGQHDGTRQVLAVNTAGLLIRRDVWDELGGLDPALPLLRDDVDLGWRATLAGHRVVCVTDAVIHHAEAATQERRSIDVRQGPLQRSSAQLRRLDRQHANRVLLVNLPLAEVPFAMLRLTAGTLLRVVGFLLGKLAPARARRAVGAVLGAAATRPAHRGPSRASPDPSWLGLGSPTPARPARVGLAALHGDRQPARRPRPGRGRGWRAPRRRERSDGGRGRGHAALGQRAGTSARLPAGTVAEHRPGRARAARVPGAVRRRAADGGCAAPDTGFGGGRLADLQPGLAPGRHRQRHGQPALPGRRLDARPAAAQPRLDCSRPAVARRRAAGGHQRLHRAAPRRVRSAVARLGRRHLCAAAARGRWGGCRSALDHSGGHPAALDPAARLARHRAARRCRRQPRGVGRGAAAGGHDGLRSARLPGGARPARPCGRDDRAESSRHRPAGRRRRRSSAPPAAVAAGSVRRPVTAPAGGRAARSRADRRPPGGVGDLPAAPRRTGDVSTAADHRRRAGRAGRPVAPRPAATRARRLDRRPGRPAGGAGPDTRQRQLADAQCQRACLVGTGAARRRCRSGRGSDGRSRGCPGAAGIHQLRLAAAGRPGADDRGRPRPDPGGRLVAGGRR